jgi:hypothetical protein
MEVVVVETHISGRQTDANTKRDGRLARAVEPVDGLLDGDGRRDPIGRPGEGRHDPVAKMFDDSTPLCLDGLGQQPVVGAAQLLRRLLPEAAPKLGRPDQVGEDDGGGGPGHSGDGRDRPS